MKINKNIQSLKISDTNFLYFDIFRKNNKLYLIIPVYNKNTDFLKNIRIENNNQNLTIIKKILKIKYEPIIILIYSCNSNDSRFKLYYKHFKKDYILNNIETTKKYNLTLTTLFKNDIHLFPMFYSFT